MKLTLILLILAMLTGCNILPKPAAVHDFGLATTKPTSGPTYRSQTELVTVEAPKWLYDNRIRYRLLYAAPTQVKFYSLDRWLAPPPELFEQLLLASNLDAAQPIAVYLIEFEQHFIQADQAKVVMGFKVVATKSAGQQEKSQEFHLEQNCLTADAKGAITAFSKLSYKAVQSIRAWLY